MKTKNIKLLFLTGTPLINNPFELVPTFNLLRGYLDEKETTLFPENYDTFAKYFINTDENLKKFQNRIIGLVSYYGDYYFTDEKRKGFPEQLPLKIEQIEMSVKQFSKYKEMRAIELKETSTKYKTSTANKSESFGSSGLSGSYRIRSRQVSNFYIPENYIVGKEKKIDSMPNSLFTKESLKIYSPKFYKLLDNLEKYKNKLGLIYTEFVSGEGMAVLKRTLETAGMEEYQINDNDLDMKGTAPKFAIISGQTPPDLRGYLVKKFNSDNNKDGSIIQYILFSKTGAEGLSFKRVRHIHIMEPFWNYARIEQVIARGVRYLSHEDLPDKERNIRPFLYIATYNDSKKVLKENTTDEEIFRNAFENKKKIINF
jgi:hypothetical protein